MAETVTDPLIPFPDAPHTDAIDRLLRATFGLPHDRELQGYEQMVYDYYSNPDELRRLMTCLDPRLVALLVLRHGLADNKPATLKDVGRSLGGVSAQRIRQLEAKAMALLRWDARQQRIADEQATSIDSLFEPFVFVDERARNVIRRNGIHTVEELTLKTEDELLSMVNFGPISLARVKTILAERGLSLAG